MKTKPSPLVAHATFVDRKGKRLIGAEAPVGDEMPTNRSMSFMPREKALAIFQWPIGKPRSAKVTRFVEWFAA